MENFPLMWLTSVVNFQICHWGFLNRWCTCKYLHEFLKKSEITLMLVFFQGLGGRWFMKKTWSKKSCDTFPWSNTIYLQDEDQKFETQFLCFQIKDPEEKECHCCMKIELIKKTGIKYLMSIFNSSTSGFFKKDINGSI